MKKTYYCYFPTGVGLSLLSYVLASLAMTTTNVTTDQLALLDLRDKIRSDPHQILAKNWSFATSVCDWRGVTCGSHHYRVIALNISKLGLTGTIPPQLGNLSFLVSLDMSWNNFQGELPHELIHLRRLRVLNLTANKLGGSIPSWVGSLQKLHYFSLKNNSFAGSIPPSISNMSNLERLILSYNSLQGAIPAEIGNLSKLKTLTVNYNQLSGPLPVEMINISSLETLSFEGNSLSGSLPVNMCLNLQRLTRLDLGFNAFAGVLPAQLSQCSKLQKLSIYSNKFSGVIPEEFGNLTMLDELDLGSNELSGSIPPKLGHLKHLELLSLSNNSLTGSIPTQIFNISSLQVLDLMNNSFSGNIPSTVGYGLINLEELYLSVNKFDGVIPDSISNASQLSILQLAGNKFSGPIPNSLGDLRVLTRLDLAGNHLTTEPSSTELSFISHLTNCNYLKDLSIGDNPLHGFLPISVGNLSTSLERLYAYSCEIKGKIPEEIGNLSNLWILSLHGNQLSGSIPLAIKGLQNLQVLYFEDNQLGGSVPESLCGLNSLYVLYLDQNQLQGSIPSCLSNITSLGEVNFGWNLLNSSIPASLCNLNNLLALNLSSNALTGSLPQEIQNMQALADLDLSRNRLNGKVPSSIGGLERLASLSLAHNKLEGTIPDSLRRMLSLEILDLSNNNLSGPIPKSLETLLYHRYINLSFNHLTGEIPSSGPFKNFTYESFMFNDDLCGAQRFHVPPCSSPRIHSRKKILQISGIISSIAAIVIATIMVILILRCRRKDETSGNTDLSLGVPKWISYYELVQATDGYDESNLLGKGSFGSVYKGTLTDGTLVAVKVFSLLVEITSRSFDTECEVLRNLRHRNLTKVIGSCSNLDFKALVVDYMSNGSLEKWLYSNDHCLDLVQRISIMVDVASALEYLHFGYVTPVVHCDLKPSNILLDENMIAHVSDFGITKFLEEGNSVLHTETLATLGYMAPEYGLEGLVSTRIDVYSFGIVLMETFSRMKPSDEMFSEDLSLKSWIEKSLPTATIHVTDANLLKRQDEHFNGKLECVSMIFNLALRCCTECPQDRMNMKDALAALKKIKRQLDALSDTSARKHVLTT